jgi:hypothetical protein
MLRYSRLVVIALAVGLNLHALAQDGWSADPALVAQIMKRYPDRMVDESKVRPYTLPDALRNADGTLVSTAEQWPKRRAEILELFRSEMFGRPPGKPQELSFEVVEERKNALDGHATLKRVAIRSRHEGRTHSFELALFIPNAPAGPVPAFLLLNNRDPQKNTDATRKVKSEFWPVEEMVSRGYAMGAIQNNDLAPDVKTDHTSWKQGIIRLFEGDRADGPRAPDATMALAAWAWGASRAMDYLETEARVDAKHVAVVGHSRGGKTALWAAAEDTRFAMAVSNNSGSCGAAISRRRFGERIALTHTNPHWFCDNFRKYHEREDELPFDQHMLIGLIAPRAVYVTSATEDLYADPRGEFLGLAHSSSVYALWGHPAIAPDAMPAADTPLVSGPRAYHIRTGRHDLTAYDWARFADFADAVWPDAKRAEVKGPGNN